MRVGNEKRIRVICVDDDHMVIDALADYLRRMFDVVHVAYRLEDVVPALERVSADVVVLDISLNGKSSLPLLAEISKTRRFPCRFLAMTGFKSTALESAAYEAGALGFIGKGGTGAALGNAIREVAAGRRYPALKNITKPSVRGLKEESGLTVRVGGIEITKRDLTALRAFRDTGSRAGAAKMLKITVRGVDYHIRKIGRKIGLQTKWGLLKWLEENER